MFKFIPVAHLRQCQVQVLFPFIHLSLSFIRGKKGLATQQPRGIYSCTACFPASTTLIYISIHEGQQPRGIHCCIFPYFHHSHIHIIRFPFQGQQPRGIYWASCTISSTLIIHITKISTLYECYFVSNLFIEGSFNGKVRKT